jgi:putative membrane protein
MAAEKQRLLIALGWILLVIGFILLVFGFGSEEWIHQQAIMGAFTGDYQFWVNMESFRQLCIPLSIFFIIFGGIILFSQMIIPSKKENKSMKENTPINILRLRYAKGEITKEQYEQMKKDLEK